MGHLCKAEKSKGRIQMAAKSKAENRKAEIIVVIILYYKSISTTLKMIKCYECR